MDNIMVAVIMIALIAFFVVGAIIAHKNGNAGFVASVKYDERLSKKNRKAKESEESAEQTNEDEV